MRSRRTLIAAVILVAGVVSAATGFALFALPFFAILALLVSGRFVGEERILALRQARSAPRPRRTRSRRWRRPRPSRARSLFACAPRTFRGPPAFTAVV